MTIRKTIVAAAFALLGTSAHADITLDPLTGASNIYVNWETEVGTGFFVPVQIFGGSFGNNAYITVDADETIDFSISDGGIHGDAFALTLDGVLLAPTSGNLGPDTRGPGATSFYSAFYDDIALSAGSHTFRLYVTDACCTSGGTYASFSPVSSVPEPSSNTMLAAGLGITGLAALRRNSGRRRRA
ncbi:PEP-CTERM sorting domain-containing protein [Pseudoduganella umbonata]|uniref:PEP-CTERM sorting domain-containing protein n=1 Tax=Pseudoduganella umbonata TaxID=864828 RepID=A0A4P8HXE9_9BURK|nr:PEP-CTERM sorting domain-containing protein [Pseudoduganella umbonata]MBB3223481.1 hypothetical protein [Pseudoduganella umbonata]QCP13632.1 PEP-CTERM sorting domain-containing protein [Pseudoduganella umbonata]